ncbi:Ku70/Ku80 beta-barrel domain protein [Ostertagia ostertagi]
MEATLVAIGIDSESAGDAHEAKSLVLDIVKHTDGISYGFKLVSRLFQGEFCLRFQIIFLRVFRDAVSVVHHFSTPVVDSRAIRKNWEIAPGVRLPLAMYTKSVAAKNPLKSVLVNEEGVEAESSSSQFADLTEREKRIQVYYFGDTKVPIGEDDEDRYNRHNFNEGEQRGCMKLIQFTKRENIKECFFIGRNSFVVVPGWEKKTSERDLEAMRTTVSLISAMLENGVVAICRYASDAAKHLQLMALIPHRDEELDFVYLQALRLPFAEDMRPFNFVSVSESCPKPNHKQMNLIDELIDVMQFSAESGSMEPESVLNPFFQRQCTAMKLKALNNINSGDDSKIADLIAPSSFLKRGLEPHPDLLEEGRVSLHETEKYYTYHRLFDDARDRLNDNFEFHMSSMLEEVVVMVSADDEEAEQLYETKKSNFLLAVNMSAAAVYDSVSPTPSIESVAAEIRDLTTSIAGETDAVTVASVFRKECDSASPFYLGPSCNQMAICDVVYDSAKENVFVADYQKTITAQQIITFTQEIERAATKDESGNSCLMISELYSVLSRSPPEVRECFKRQVISQLVLSSNTTNGCISCQLLSKKLTKFHEFLDLVMAEISNKLSWENGMKDCPFYYAVFAERCVFFHLDPQRTGKVSISELTSTRLLDDLFEVVSMQKRAPDDKSWDTPSSWCSIGKFWRVLEQFRNCDRDGSGMVSLEECRGLREGTITPLFLERVFANQILYGDQPPYEMDFRGFVDLDVAITSRNVCCYNRFKRWCSWIASFSNRHPLGGYSGYSILRDDGFLDRDEIRMMIQSMLENLSAMENWAMSFNADDIVDEIIDMINAAETNRIVIDDVLACNMAETALGILIDYVAFLKYENREEEAGN